MNISSIIVKTLPKNFDEVMQALKESGVCDVHFGEKEKGIIIVTIEGKNVEEEIEKVRILEALPKVISADMHMSYCEEELEEMKKDKSFLEKLPSKRENLFFRNYLDYLISLHDRDISPFRPIPLQKAFSSKEILELFKKI